MTFIEWLKFFSVPSILLSVMTAIWVYVATNMKKQKMESDAIKAGMQALLRANMISQYNKWKEKGYAPIYAKDNFENCHKNYENLGANGVINNIYNEFMNLPNG